MSFDTLFQRMKDEAFSPKLEKRVLEKKFFKFEKDDYDRKDEQSKLMRFRLEPKPGDTVSKITIEESKYGWMCGMDRDYRIQNNEINYLAILKNNYLLKESIESRLDDVRNRLLNS